MAFVKISDGMCKAIGASTEEEFSTKFEAWLLSQNATSDSAKTIVTDVQAVKKTAEEAKTIGTEAKTAISAIKVDDIIAKAKEAANLTATTVLGQVGQTAAVPVAPATPKSEASAHEQLLAAGEFEKAFAVAPDKAEFADAKSYAAYQKNKHLARVKE